MLNCLIVFIGGGLGALCRYLVSLMFMIESLSSVNQKAMGTIFVNIIGCFLIAIVDGLLKKYHINLFYHSQLRLLFITGFLGGFTTYSSFLFDIFNYADNHNLMIAGLYLFASIFLGILSFCAGLYLIK